MTKRTLKNWLRAGRIPEPPRNPKNNYRVWTLTDVEAARQLLLLPPPPRDQGGEQS